MAANLTKNQVKINGSVTVEHGQVIIGSNVEYNEYHLSIIPAQDTPAERMVKYHFYGVPTENHAFVDRPSILTNMETTLCESSLSGGCRILALKGLGGMGKSQLMLRYCYLHRAAYDFVFWLEVDSWLAAVDSFRKLAINLGLEEESSEGKEPEEKIIDRVSSWLQMKKNWLLLLNNADVIISKDIFKLLPRIGGHIIMTTREPIPSTMARVIPVDKMQKEEALLLLFGVSSMDLIEQEDSRKLHYAREIVTELDFMPLAIDLARAYINNTLISFQKYLSIFKDSKRRISLFRYNDEEISNHYKHNVATVWQLSFEKIRALNPITVPILEACAFLQPEDIPVRLFKRQYSLLQLVTPSSAAPEEQDSGQFCEIVGKAIAMLVKFSFVARTCQEAEDNEESPASDVLTIHRLVQKVIYDTIVSDQRLSWAYNLARALNKDTEYDGSAIYTICTQRIVDTYLPHIRHFVTMLDSLHQKPLASEDLCELLDRTIWYLLQHERYSGIEELVQFSRLVSEAAYGEDDVRIVMSLINHGMFHRELGKYGEAEPLYQRALAITEKAKGSEHPDTAQSLNNLAILYNDRGRHDEAEPLYKQALMIFEKAFGSEHPDTAMSLNNLALLYNDRGKHDEAEPLYKQALMIFKKALGSEHPDTAMSLNNLADVYSAQGNYDEAESLYKQALAIREKSLGLEHPSTATSLNNLALFYFSWKKYDEAEPLYKQALAIREKSLGSEHPDTATSLNNLAILYDNRGKYDEAEPLYKQALASREKSLGLEHPRTATSLNNLAGVYSAQGKYDEAESLYKQALVIRKKSLGLEHPDTAALLNNLAAFYENRGKYGEAELLNKQALAIRVKSLGSEHPDTVKSLNNLADVYSVQGNYDEAESLYKQALAIRKKFLGLEHPDTAQSLNNLGGLCAHQNNFAKAQEWFLQAAGAIHITQPIDVSRTADMTLERFWSEVARGDLQITIQQLLNNIECDSSVVFAIGVFCELGLNIPKDFPLAMKLFAKVTKTAKNSKVLKLAKNHQENLLNRPNERDHGLTRQPCGRAYLKEEEYYQCFTCGQRNSCLCLRCFYSTNHDNHNVVMMFNYGKAFCDCGIPDMWKIDLDCPYHTSPLPSQFVAKDEK